MSKDIALAACYRFFENPEPISVIVGVRSVQDDDDVKPPGTWRKRPSLPHWRTLRVAHGIRSGSPIWPPITVMAEKLIEPDEWRAGASSSCLVAPTTATVYSLCQTPRGADLQTLQKRVLRMTVYQPAGPTAAR
jgi:hypothetical protein